MHLEAAELSCWRGSPRPEACDVAACAAGTALCEAMEGQMGWAERPPRPLCRTALCAFVSGGCITITTWCGARLPANGHLCVQAAALGLNLTCANHVVLLDPWCARGGGPRRPQTRPAVRIVRYSCPPTHPPAAALLASRLSACGGLAYMSPLLSSPRFAVGFVFVHGGVFQCVP